jgi:hypothetical protein
MGKFERAILSSGGTETAHPVPPRRQRDGTRRDKLEGDATSPPRLAKAGRRNPSPPPAGRSPRHGHVPDGALIQVKHDGHEGATREEISRMLDRPGRRPLILTSRERHLAAARIRELNREVIPGLLGAMQSPSPDPSDRESYHRATNELDWLVEILERSETLDGAAMANANAAAVAAVDTPAAHAVHAAQPVRGRGRPLQGTVDGRDERSTS